MKPRPKHPKLLFAACILAAGTYAPSVMARTFTGGDNSSFSTASNWSPSGVPGATANDVLTVGDSSVSGLSGDLHVTINGLFGTTNTISSLTFDSVALPQALVLTETGGTIQTTTETLGNIAFGNTFNQGNGSTNIAATLNLGVTAASFDNFYNLTGAGTSLTVTSNFNLGVAGIGVLTQSDGTVTVHNTTNGNAHLTLGSNSGSSGTYNLNAGTLTVDVFDIAAGGDGIFNQSGGALTVSANVFFFASSGQKSIYNYSGGTATFTNGLTAGSGAIFNLQTGGALPFNVTVASGGIFNFAGGSFGTGNVILSGGTFQLQGHSLTATSHLSGTGTIQNGSATTAATLTFSPASATSLAANIIDGSSAATAFTLASGTLTLSGNNIYSGATTISGGTLKAGSATAFSPNSPVNITAGTLDAQTFSPSIPSLAGSGTVNVPSGNLTIGSSLANTTYSGIFHGAGGIIKTGANTLTLTGNNADSLPITVNNGTLSINGFLVASNSTVTVNNSAILSVGPLGIVIATLNTGAANSIVINNELDVGSTNVNSTISGNFSGTGTSLLFFKDGSGNLTIGLGSSDTFSNPPSVVKVEISSGTLRLAKAPGTNAINSPLLIDSGATVLLTASNQIADSVDVTTQGGLFDLNGFNETIGSLNGDTGGGVINVRTGTLTIAQSANTTYSGTILGSGTLIKSLTGPLTLSNLSLYTGNLSAAGGILILSGNVNASATASAGGILQFTQSALTTPTTLNATGGTITQTGSGTMTIGAASGGASTITVGLGGIFSTATGLTTVNATGQINQSNGNFDLNGDLTVTGGTINQTGGAFTWAGGHIMTIQSSATVTLTTLTAVSATINVINSQFNVSSAGESSFGTAGTATLTYSNSSTGNIGGLTLGHATGSSGTLSVLSNASIHVGSIDVGTSPFASTGAVTVNGGILTQNNNSTLTIGSATVGIGTITVKGGGTFNIFPGGTVTINPTGTLNILADGFLNINANVTNSGTVNILGLQGWNSGNSFTNNAGTATFNTDAGSSSVAPLSIVLSAGTLIFNTAEHLNALTVNGGTLGGHGSANLGIPAGTANYTIAPSASFPPNTIGFLTLASLSTTSHTTLALNLIKPNTSITSDTIVLSATNGLTLNGGAIQITGNPTGVSSLGYYKILQYTGALQGTGISSLTLPAVANNIAYTLDTQHDPGYIDIHRGYIGDDDDNGTINIDDYLALDAAYLHHTANPAWSNGDFNDDNTIDFNDYALIDFAYQHQSGVLADGEIALHTAEFGAPYTDALSALDGATPVPEPASLAFFLTLLPALLTRRRPRIK